jgi:hypothetical protein
MNKKEAIPATMATLKDHPKKEPFRIQYKPIKKEWRAL